MLLLEAPLELGERFQAGTVGGAREYPVISRWTRSAALGVDPSSSAFPAGTGSSDLSDRRARLDAVLHEARGLVDTPAFADRGLVSIVADPDGVIVMDHGGGDFADGAARVRLVPGACWDEGTRGTNAIGTAIAERAAVGVIGPAHFERRNAGLFCFASPVFDAHGELACVLDVTGRLERHDPSIGATVALMANALTAALRRQALSSGGAFSVIQRLVHRSSGAALVVEADGAIRVANRPARTLLGVSEGDPGLDCQHVFGLSYAELSELARTGQRARFETPWQTFGVELDPVLGADHRFLAVVVYLEQSSKQRASRVIERPRSRPPQAPHHPAFDRVLGSDPELLRAKSLAARFAATPLPVVLLSETGTGKELFARAIHEASPRAAGPFVAMNCGAVPESLLESELFGFAPGAFTGAARRGSEGKLAAADGGTLFLDEIAETSSGFQAALLRALDDGSYFRVGESRARHVSLRLVCATCRDLPDLVHSGKFRSDLFYRIHGACLRLPALRDRTDRVELSRALLAAAAKEQGRSAPALADDAVSWLESHTWPGNVRELKSALCHALALCDGSTLRREHFPEPLAPASRTVEVEGHTREEILEEAVRQALDASSGNVSAAARMLGVARSTVYRILRTRQ